MYIAPMCTYRGMSLRYPSPYSLIYTLSDIDTSCCIHLLAYCFTQTRSAWLLSALSPHRRLSSAHYTVQTLPHSSQDITTQDKTPHTHATHSRSHSYQYYSNTTLMCNIPATHAVYFLIQF